ncbi:hypothetical protein CEXT_382111 [Caerostris extrusa]|uniref:Uncharacterized protein n=1 Tax=Caerostris extrusa TaxID=172846 RepID=A0AAV4VHJ1_CAEEX|nr:hypothetical protein CEXT_382111 [Caerostris extrusa]
MKYFYIEKHRLVVSTVRAGTSLPYPWQIFPDTKLQTDYETSNACSSSAFLPTSHHAINIKKAMFTHTIEWANNGRTESLRIRQKGWRRIHHEVTGSNF